MTPYGVTVLIVVFGLLMAALDMLLLLLTPWLLANLARVAPDRRTNAILFARFAPVGVAGVLTALVFLPAWWRHEPSDAGEIVSGTLLALALVALLPILQGLHRALRMFVRTRDRLLSWRRRGRNAPGVQAPFDVVEVLGEDLALCVGGYLRPTIYASTDVMKALEPEEFSAALAHEVSHATARDPLRLLWMGSCPDFLQLVRLDDPWRRAFSRACEFAADVVARRGNREVALDLASALLKVARLRTHRRLPAETMMDMAVSSAFSSQADLEARVQSLANPLDTEGVIRFSPRTWILVAAVLVLCCTGVIASEQVHAFTEGVGRLLAP